MKPDAEQTYHYIVLNPTGNITALVTDSVEVSRQPFFADKIMARHPEVEQVGFVDLSGIEVEPVHARLRMAGGEFCGNASMCTAVLYEMEQGVSGLEDAERKVILQVSGAEEPVEVSLRGNEESGYFAGVKMPSAKKIRTVRLKYRDLTDEAVLVEMQGISHLIIEKGSAFFSLLENPEAAETAVKQWCGELSAEGLGLMFLEEEDNTRTLTPLVYIPESKTIFWENSCGSGSSACALYLSEKTSSPEEFLFQEPGGVLRVAVASSGSVKISGGVKIIGRHSITF